MAIRIIKDDLVDWEPLIFRIVPSRGLSATQAQQIVSFVRDWFNAAADARPSVWSASKEWDCRVAQGEIVAQCELFPPNELPLLAEDLSREFPVLKEVWIGVPISGPKSTADAEWFSVGTGTIHIGDIDVTVKPFLISFSPVTIGQFEEFLNVQVMNRFLTGLKPAEIS